MDGEPRDTLDVAVLTRSMVAGDEAAYRTFSEVYFDRLSRYLLVVSRGNEEAAREALQGALVRVVRHIRVFSNEAVFWGWLTVLARSALADQGRRRRRYQAFLDRFRERSATEQAVSGSEAAESELLALLDQNLALLPDEDRHLLECKYSAGESVRQIAERLCTTEKAIESRLSRIRRKIKAAMLQSLRNE